MITLTDEVLEQLNKRIELLDSIILYTRSVGLPREKYDEIKIYSLTIDTTVEDYVEEGIDWGRFVWRGDYLFDTNRNDLAIMLLNHIIEKDGLSIELYETIKNESLDSMDVSQYISDCIESFGRFQWKDDVLVVNK